MSFGDCYGTMKIRHAPGAGEARQAEREVRAVTKKDEGMEIGEKVRYLRLQRKMTQAELAGDQITRNMLSRIENGVALPSLATVWYLAERLDVPAGFLLAEGEDDRIWKKMGRIDSIRRVLRSGDARICLDLCRGDAEAGEADDEIYLIMTQCSLMVASEEFDRGHLRECCAYLDRTIEYAKKTLYNTDGMEQTAALYFRFLHRLSATLTSDLLREEDTPLIGSKHPFGCYVLAREALEAGADACVDAYRRMDFSGDVLANGKEWQEHFDILCEIRAREYADARERLLHLLNAQQARSEVLVYCVFGDLEICCREMGDFRGAYEYSQNKVAILERMLQE